VFDYADTAKNEISQIFNVGKVLFHIYSLIGIWWVISEMKSLVRHTDSFVVWTSCKKYANTLIFLSNVNFFPHFLAIPGVTAVLNYVDLPVINNTECAAVFGSYIIASTLCLSTIGGHSTCNASVYYARNPIFSVPFIEYLCHTKTCVFFPVVLY